MTETRCDVSITKVNDVQKFAGKRHDLCCQLIRDVLPTQIVNLLDAESWSRMLKIMPSQVRNTA